MTGLRERLRAAVRWFAMRVCRVRPAWVRRVSVEPEDSAPWESGGGRYYGLTVTIARRWWASEEDVHAATSVAWGMGRNVLRSQGVEARMVGPMTEIGEDDNDRGEHPRKETK